MKNKKLSVSVGICAFNEEANIRKLLVEITDQRGDNFYLEEIIVVSDNSSDSTIEQVRRIKDNRIILNSNKRRLGKALSQNKIMEAFSGDLLILLDADILLLDKNFISKAIEPFQLDSHFGLIGLKTMPIAGSGFFEKIINFSDQYKKAIFEKWNKGDNLFMCQGRGRVFSRKFAKQLKWPSTASEDAFAYLSCISKGDVFKYNPLAVVYYKSPSNFFDHRKQSSRFISGPRIMSKYFEETVIKNNYQIPKFLLVTTAIEYLAKNPLYFLSYFFIFILIKISTRKNSSKLATWQISQSSKLINNVSRVG